MISTRARSRLCLALLGCTVAALRLAAQETSAIQFTDIAPRSSFSYTSNNDFTGRKYFPQPMCGGIAILDYDDDGLQDIFFTNGAKLPELKRVDSSFYSALLRNLGDGTFEDVTARAGLEGANIDFSFGVAAGDYDNDGFTDLFLAQAGRNVLYHNEGDGTFSDVSVGSGLDTKPEDLLSVCAAWFDYDRDGRLDLVVSHYTYWTPETDIVCSIEGHGEIYCAPTRYQSVPHSLYHNEGEGRFVDVSEPSGFAAATAGKGMGIAIADYDGDDWMDVFVSNDTEPNQLFINRHDGTFDQAASLWMIDYNDMGNTVSGMGADAKDYDNDGHVDVFCNNLMMQVWSLFRNDDGMQFVYASPESRVMSLSKRFSGWSNGFIDYDNDGWKDIYSSNGDVDYMPENAEQRDTMFRNLEGNGFEDVAESLGDDFVPLGFQRGSAFGDLNDDGFLDIVVTSLNRKPRILINSADNGHHWLLVKTRGRSSNRDAIGTKLKLTTASGRVLYNHVTTSVGFMSSSDKRVHFGLGPETGIESLEITWPNGTRQTLTDVEADQILSVKEPPSMRTGDMKQFPSSVPAGN